MTQGTEQIKKIADIWKEHLEVAQNLPKLSSAVSDAVDLIYMSLAAGGLLLIAGNGGSAADAQHIAAELTGRFFRERQPFRALALHVNTSSLTAIGNDYGYEHVFARELSAHARPGDVFLAISTSGNSGNILRAIEAARKAKVSVIGLTGEIGRRDAEGLRPLSLRPHKIDAADSGNAHHHRPCHVRTAGTETG